MVYKHYIPNFCESIVLSNSWLNAESCSQQICHLSFIMLHCFYQISCNIVRQKVNLFRAFNTTMSMKLFFRTILIIFFIQNSIIANALQIVSQEIHQADITVGDKVIYTITVKSDKNSPLEVERIPSTSEYLDINFPEIRILDGKISESDRVIKDIVFELFPFEPGENEIPPVSIKCDDQTVKSKPMRFEVKSVLPSNAKGIRDIKKQVDMPRNWLVYFFFGIVVLIVFVSSLYFIKQYSSSEESSIPKKPERLPHETAYQRLANVKKMKLVEKSQMKEYYSKISQIIKAYISERYEINALESTSYELMRNPKIQSLSKEVREMLREILQTSDFVKFAKYEPDKAEASELVKLARRFIDKTKESDTEFGRYKRRRSVK